MEFLRKNKLEIIIGIVLLLVYLGTRLPTILDLPIFTDEAIYVRWAQIAKNDAAWRFISLTDGKQPSFIWLSMVSMRFIHDPLLAARLVSVGAGILTAIGLFFLGKELFRNKWVGIVSSFFYVIFPFALVYDRLALYDSLVGTFSVWSLYLIVLLNRKLRLDTALILGLVIGGAVLTKTNGFFSLYLIPFSLVIFNWQRNNLPKRLLKWVGLVIVSAVLAYACYSVLRLSPFFHIIDEKNTIFVFPLREWLQHPLEFFLSNWKGLWNWMITYLTIPLFALAMASFFITKRYTREKILLLLWALIPFVFLAFFGKTIYPRFILFMTLFLLPLVAFTMVTVKSRLSNTYLYAFFFLLSISFALFADYKISTDFIHAPIPRPDADQYVKSWPAGGGIKEAVVFFEEQAQRGPIFLATQGTFGLMPYAFEIYLGENTNIKIVGVWPIEQTPPQEIMEMGKKMPTYFVFYQPCPPCQTAGNAPSAWPIKLISRYTKPDGKSFFSIYQVNP